MGESASTFFDSLILNCNIFVLGVGIGAFLCYHYLVKKDVPRMLITSDESSTSPSGWRNSNPDELAVERPSEHSSRRRRSSLYH